MSELKSAETATESAQPDKQEPDDSEPSPERQAELRKAYEKNTAGGNPPYAGVVISSRGELNWIIGERGWRTYAEAATPGEVPDLRETGLRADLRNINLTFANLGCAYIEWSNFNGADLGLADLAGVAIQQADFTEADLSAANLGSSYIDSANFTGASLVGANLSGATISGIFKGADLSQARMDGTTILGSFQDDEKVQIDTTTRLLDVAWNGAILANVRWEDVPRLGDEADIKAAETRAERVVAIRNAARAYRGLAKALQAQGLTAPALKYRTREYQLERRALLYSFALGPWIFSWLLNIVSGYGDKPARALACYLAVVGSCAGAYWAITNQVFSFITSSSAHLAWYEALVLSISSFHGRGFFPSIPSLGDPIAIVAAAEAIIGLFIELVFIATFTQRFFAR